MDEEDNFQSLSQRIDKDNLKLERPRLIHGIN